MKKLQLVFIVLVLMSLNAFSQKQDTAQAKKAFVPSGKLWGYVFGDYMYKTNTNSFNMSNTQYGATTTSGTSSFTTPKNYNSFEFRRIYLGYDYDISEHFSSQVLLAYEGGNFSSDASRSVFIKAANLRWKNIFKNADLVMGQQSTSTFATVAEPTWAYRSLEKTIMDMRKIGKSNDVGVSLQGKFNDKGDFGYNLMIGNGTAQTQETNKFKKIYADVWAKLMNQKIIIDFGGDNETAQQSPYNMTKTTIKGFAAYQTKDFTLGIEAFKQIQGNNTIYTQQTVKDTVNAIAQGVSIFTNGKITNKLRFVLRYDNYNPDAKFNSNNVYSASYNASSVFKETFVLAALDFAPMKNVHIMPNIWYDKYDNRNTAVNKLSSSSSDVAARLTVYYIFK